MTNIAYKYFFSFSLKMTITQKPIHCPQYQPFYLLITAKNNSW